MIWGKCFGSWIVEGIGKEIGNVIGSKKSYMLSGKGRKGLL